MSDMVEVGEEVDSVDDIGESDSETTLATMWINDEGLCQNAAKTAL